VYRGQIRFCTIEEAQIAAAICGKIHMCGENLIRLPDAPRSPCRISAHASAPPGRTRSFAGTPLANTPEEVPMRLESIMTRPVEIISPRPSIRTAERLLTLKAIHHLVVVDRDNASISAAAAISAR
jgi:hypothetical protein